MIKLISGNIKYMSDVKDFNLQELRDSTNVVIDYLHDEIGAQAKDFNVDIIVTKSFQNTIYHYSKSSISPEVNACLINRYIIKNKDVEKKDVIVVNWNLCEDLHKDSFTSLILLHELVHHFDYRFIDNINTDFSVNIFSKEYAQNNNELEKAIEVLFMARSEMRAYYYEEKHLGLKNLSVASIDQFKIITDDHRSISFVLPRLLGKIKYWVETNSNIDRVMEAISYVETGSPVARQWEQFIMNSFNYNEYHSICDYFTKTIKSQ